MSNVHEIDGTKLLEMYRKMVLMRKFEEAAKRAYTERKIGGFLHLYIGQEAVGCGMIEALVPDDYVISGYRVHAQYLAKGGCPKAGMAELLGKSTGCAKGRGGSMHFFDAKHRFLGGHGIVGAHIPVATGVGYKIKYRKEDNVCVCFFGEGATSIGPFHEGLCLASLYKLPVIFVIENNGYAMGTPQARQMVLEDASMRALAYPMARKTVESHDVLECYAAAKEAVDWVRKESKPYLLEFKTYRYQGHSMADPAKYRSKDEVKEHKKRDPLAIVKGHLEGKFGIDTGRISEVEAEVKAEIAEAVEFAENSPEPDPSELHDYTFVG